MQGINVAEKDCIDLLFNTHVFLTFISLNIHIMFSLRTSVSTFTTVFFIQLIVHDENALSMSLH